MALTSCQVQVPLKASENLLLSFWGFFFNPNNESNVATCKLLDESNDLKLDCSASSGLCSWEEDDAKVHLWCDRMVNGQDAKNQINWAYLAFSLHETGTGCRDSALGSAAFTVASPASLFASVSSRSALEALAVASAALALASAASA